MIDFCEHGNKSWISIKVGNFLTIWTTTNFSRSTLLHTFRVSQLQKQSSNYCTVLLLVCQAVTKPRAPYFTICHDGRRSIQQNVLYKKKSTTFVGINPRRTKTYITKLKEILYQRI